MLFHLARRRLPIAAAVASGVLTIAGCGSSSTSSSVGNGATTSSASSKSATTPGSTGKRPRSVPSYAKSQLAAAACIRSHGFPTFPDPTFGDGGAQVNLSTSINMSSPGFMLAQKECGKLGVELAGYAPTSTATAAEMAQALAIAKCMRANRVPNWPDPTKTMPSNLNGYGVQSAVPGPPGGPIFVIPNSIDLESPAVKRAATACQEN